MTRSFFEFARPAPPRRPRWGSRPPPERDTCFVNIVRRYRPPCLTSGSQAGIHQPAWELSPGSGPTERSQRETPSQGHDRNKCALHAPSKATSRDPRKSSDMPADAPIAPLRWDEADETDLAQ